MIETQAKEPADSFFFFFPLVFIFADHNSASGTVVLCWW